MTDKRELGELGHLGNPTDQGLAQVSGQHNPTSRETSGKTEGDLSGKGTKTEGNLGKTEGKAEGNLGKTEGKTEGNLGKT